MLENGLSYLASVLGIVLMDLVLSGDNAIVIGMAARRLPPRQRRMAILLGGGGAIGLRVLFAAGAALLLTIPLLQAAGGLLLLWIAWKLLREEAVSHKAGEGLSLFGALRTIILADVAMSLDNILAIAAISHGSVALLLFGLMLSMPLILFGSGIVATLLNRMPWLAVAGSGILAWTAGAMIVGDEVLSRVVPQDAMFVILVPIALTVGLLAPSVRGMLPSWRHLPRSLARLGGMARMSPVPVTTPRGRRQGDEGTQSQL